MTEKLATLYSEAGATILKGYKFTPKLSEGKVHCSQLSKRNIKMTRPKFSLPQQHQRLLHFTLEGCKNELKQLKLTLDKGKTEN